MSEYDPQLLDYTADSMERAGNRIFIALGGIGLLGGIAGVAASLQYGASGLGWAVVAAAVGGSVLTFGFLTQLQLDFRAQLLRVNAQIEENTRPE